MVLKKRILNPLNSMHGQILSNDPFLLHFFCLVFLREAISKCLDINDEALNYVFELKEDNQQHQKNYTVFLLSFLEIALLRCIKMKILG